MVATGLQAEVVEEIQDARWVAWVSETYDLPAVTSGLALTVN